MPTQEALTRKTDFRITSQMSFTIISIELKSTIINMNNPNLLFKEMLKIKWSSFLFSLRSGIHNWQFSMFITNISDKNYFSCYQKTECD